MLFRKVVYSPCLYSEFMLQDDLELSQWKQLLDRDVEILKAKANISKVQSVSENKLSAILYVLLNTSWFC